MNKEAKFLLRFTEPEAEAPLKKIMIICSPRIGLSPVRLHQLRLLDLDNTDVSDLSMDLSPLSCHLYLETLIFQNTKISDPLSEYSELKVLNII